MPATKEIFMKYPNDIFIETGTFYGDGVQMALDAGFKTVYSIELSEALYNASRDRFKGNPNVKLLHGDCVFVLEQLLGNINGPCTFWFDAHYCCAPSEMGVNPAPILVELYHLKNHHIKTHTILIDDLCCWRMEITGFDVETMKERILAINPNYQFRLEGDIVHNDILAAYIL